MSDARGNFSIEVKGLESIVEEVKQLLNLEQLIDLAQQIEERAEAAEVRSQASTSVRPMSSIPRRGNIPRSGTAQPRPAAPSDPVPEVVTPPSSPSGRSLEQRIGGLAGVLSQLRDLVEIPLKRPDILTKLGLEPPKGVLLVGPPGTGKTLTARTLAEVLGVNYIAIVGPEIVGKYYGEAEARLRQVFEKAVKSAPCLIFIDEIDALVPNRANVEGEVEKRLVAQLLGLMDGFDATRGAIVLAATNRPDAIDPALRRPGRFDREIVFPVPDRAARRQILAVHTANMPLAADVDLEALADRALGFVGADLKGLCQTAAYRALQRQVPDLNAVPATLHVSQADFEAALSAVRPAVLRSLHVEVPSVRWSDIGGMEAIKQTLQEAVAGALIDRELYARARARAPRGILLSGPPGTGKTLLAKAIATEARANFISIAGPELLTKWVGATEQAIRQLFAQARQASPCVIFIDELDTLAPARGSFLGDSGVSDRAIGQLLVELDGLQSAEGILAIAATNRKEAIDPALMRSGRIELHVPIDLPDRDTRRAILAVHNRDRPLAADVDLDEWADRTESCSGADLAFLSNRAAIVAIRRHQREGNAPAAELEVTAADFHRAIAELQQQRSQR